MTLDQSLEDSRSNLLSSSMVRGLHRRSRWLEGSRSLRSPRAALLLVGSCLLSCCCFLLVFYLNIAEIKLLLLPPDDPLPSGYFSPRNIFFRPPKSERKLSPDDQKIVYKDFNYLKPESLNYTRQNYSNNVSILYRFPQQRETKGLLFIFHGCGRSAHDWFHTIERQRIVGAAIDLGYACLAFQATDEMRRCWSSEVDFATNEDIQMVTRGLEGFYKEHPKLESLPRYTFGASSGGIFSSVFAVNPRYSIQGQILFISIVHPNILADFIGNKTYPATAWIYMVNDEEFASEHRINASMKLFAKENIPHIAFRVEPISVKPLTFHERIPTITIGTSQYLHHRFLQNKWLDEMKFFIHNPRRDNSWQTFLYEESNNVKTKEYLDNLQKHKDIIPDFLNTIYGEHEISFERSFEALKWLQTISTKTQ